MVGARVHDLSHAVAKLPVSTELERKEHVASGATAANAQLPMTPGVGEPDLRDPMPVDEPMESQDVTEFMFQ